MSDHAVIERQIAAMHRVIAARIRAGDGAPLAIAEANLARWERQFGGTLPAAYREWRELLAQGAACVIEVLEADSETATRQRSSSPFAGVLSARERWELLERAA